MDAIIYKTIRLPSQGLYKEKGSKFLSFAIPVSSEEEIKTTLDYYKKQYYDARHSCYAYVLGYQKERYRVYDDGEPNHSAGDPILNQIKSFDLTDILVLVVRYFGGTKLGVGGLVTAYKTAAYDALKQAEIIEKIPTINYLHRFDYEQMNSVMAIIKHYELKIIQQHFELHCSVTLEIPLHLEEEVNIKLTGLDN